MRVAIAQVDGKWPNLALAKIAAAARAGGHTVERFNPLLGADRVYASKVFTDTADDPYLPPDAIRGGSGYSLSVKLMPWIERLRPDWSLWPQWRHDMGYSTRGCPRRCPFCVVPKKDGKLRVVAEFGDLWSGRKRLILLDGNVTAAPMDHFRRLCDEATTRGVELDFSQGLDARLLTDEHAAIIARSKVKRSLHLAFDHPRHEKAVRRSVRLLREAGVNVRHDVFYFVLVGYDTTPEEDLYRCELLRDLGTNPFVMPYDRSDRYQRDLARWANSVAAFRSCSFADYRRDLHLGRVNP
jgi:hypothetical protein